MEIFIRVPIKDDIISKGFTITTSPIGTTWKKEQLGEFANKSGIYIHHCNSQILYIGETTSGKWAKFGERLRRQFQENGSKNKDLYNLLNKQENPIKTYMLELDEIDMMVIGGAIELTKERKALIMEQVLIGAFSPIGNKK